MEEKCNSDQLVYRKDEWAKNPDLFLTGATVSCVILGFNDGIVKVLLNRYRAGGKWALPGGFAYLTEDFDDAARNILRARTGIQEKYLEPFNLFGKANRINPEEYEALLNIITSNPSEYLKSKFLNRFLTIGYITLVNYEEVQLKCPLYEESKWFHIEEVPSLFSDHNEIIDSALKAIRKNLGRIPIGMSLLSEKFTMGELRKIYEGILGRELDRRNFQRKMLSTDLLIRLDEKEVRPGIKSSNLYSFNKAIQLDDFF